MPTKKTPNTLDASMKELEQLVSKMEQKDLPLEKSLEHFERGIALISHCQRTLHHTEQKIQQLIEDNDQLLLGEFESDDEI